MVIASNKLKSQFCDSSLIIITKVHVYSVWYLAAECTRWEVLHTWLLHVKCKYLAPHFEFNYKFFWNLSVFISPDCLPECALGR